MYQSLCNSLENDESYLFNNNYRVTDFKNMPLGSLVRQYLVETHTFVTFNANVKLHVILLIHHDIRFLNE